LQGIDVHKVTRDCIGRGTPGGAMLGADVIRDKRVASLFRSAPQLLTTSTIFTVLAITTKLVAASPDTMRNSV